MEAFFNRIVFNIGGVAIPFGTTLLFLSSLVFLFVFQRVVIRRWIGAFLIGQGATPGQRKTLKRLIYLTLTAVVVGGVLKFTGWNWDLPLEIRALDVASTIIILLLARLMDAMIGKIFLSHYFEAEAKEQRTIALHSGVQSAGQRKKAGRKIIRLFLYSTAILGIFHLFELDFTFFEGKIGKLNLSLHLSQLFVAIWMIFLARFCAWGVAHFLLAGLYRRGKIQLGMQYAINQLSSYLIFFFALMFALNVLGVNMTLLASGAAALLLGVGLGLQQTFNDFFSGLILLFERSVELGDVVEIDGLVGKVRRIGLRTSIVQTRDNRSVIVPNSKLVVNNVTNWSHDDEVARFSVGVGVAYGSDTQKVKSLLLEEAARHPKVLAQPEPQVRFTGFGESSLDFELLFWSEEFMRIEDVKSDLRFAVDQRFREGGVAIPFPQRDIWFRNGFPEK